MKWTHSEWMSLINPACTAASLRISCSDPAHPLGCEMTYSKTHAWSSCLPSGYDSSINWREHVHKNLIKSANIDTTVLFGGRGGIISICKEVFPWSLNLEEKSVRALMLKRYCIPLWFEPAVLFCLINDLGAKRLCANGPQAPMCVVIRDRGYLESSIHELLTRESRTYHSEKDSKCIEALPGNSVHFRYNPWFEDAKTNEDQRETIETVRLTHMILRRTLSQYLKQWQVFLAQCMAVDREDAWW